MKGDANTHHRSSAYGQVLSIGAFRWLWFGQICSQLAINSLLFVLSLRIYQLTGSNAAVSGIFLAHGLPAVFFGMVAGTVVDHLDKRKVLILCDILRALGVLGLMFLSQNLAVVYLITFINSIITQFYVPAEAPSIPRLVPANLLVSANSLFSFTFFSSLALGSILAGPLLRWFGPQGIFLFLAFLFALAATCISRMPTHDEHPKSLMHILLYDVTYVIQRVLGDLLEGVRYVSKVPALFDSLLLLTGTQIILAILGSLGPGFADRVLKIDVRDASLLMIGPAVMGIIVGALWVGTVGFRYNQKRLITTGIMSAGAILVLISLTVRALRIPQLSWLYAESVILPLEFVLFFLLGAANSLLDVPANTMLQEEAKGSMRGRVYGMLAAFVGGVGILPVVAGGVLADVMGVGKVIFALGIAISVYGFIRVRYNKM